MTYLVGVTVSEVSLHSKWQRVVVKFSNKLRFIDLGVTNEYSTTGASLLQVLFLSKLNWERRHSFPFESLLLIDDIITVSLMLFPWPSSACPARASSPGCWWLPCAAAGQHGPWSHPSPLVLKGMGTGDDQMRAWAAPSNHGGPWRKWRYKLHIEVKITQMILAGCH